MKKEYIDACINPARQRILQVLISRGEATSAQIGEVLSDIPRASLYRHIKLLLEADAIQVVKEENHRGAVERTYAITVPSYEENTNQDMNAFVQGILMSLGADFSKYFAQEDCNCERDMLTISFATLLLDDEEFASFLQEYAALLERFMGKEASEGRRERKIGFISAPTGDVS